ncbi:MAG: flagellar protein FliT [Pseudomonadota bacterium]
MNSTNQTLTQSLQLSRRMLELMKEGAWDEVAELEAERLRMIQQEFAAESRQEIEEKIEILREIDALNREMESIGRQGQANLSSQLREIRLGRKVAKAYGKNR